MKRYFRATNEAIFQLQMNKVESIWAINWDTGYLGRRHIFREIQQWFYIRKVYQFQEDYLVLFALWFHQIPFDDFVLSKRVKKTDFHPLYKHLFNGLIKKLYMTKLCHFEPNPHLSKILQWTIVHTLNFRFLNI